MALVSRRFEPMGGIRSEPGVERRVSIIELAGDAGLTTILLVSPLLSSKGPLTMPARAVGVVMTAFQRARAEPLP